jgi:hypothetical protein
MEINYPNKNSEFDIQSKICNYIIKKGYDIKWEITIRNCSNIKGQRQCRFDLVVFKDKIAKLIIEVKNWNWKISKRQILKYSKFWIHIVCYNEKTTSKIIDNDLLLV